MVMVVFGNESLARLSHEGTELCPWLHAFELAPQKHKATVTDHEQARTANLGEWLAARKVKEKGMNRSPN